MTFGGRVLAVCIRMDEATVNVENIDRRLKQFNPVARAGSNGAKQQA